MSARTSTRAPLIAALSTIVAACAPMPPTPAPDAGPAAPRPAPAARPQPSGTPARDAAIVRHLRLAAAAREAGDLATAAEHEDVLVLLAPDDPARRKAREATGDAIRRAVREQAERGLAARARGDYVGAREAFLRVLALDPDNADAAKALREVELTVMARVQADRAARVRANGDMVASTRARPGEARSQDSFDLEQRLELVRSGDATAMRELRAWVDANPGDRTMRQRIGGAVAERAREVEAKGQREAALGLYEQAVTLAGTGAPDWTARMQALRKSLGEHYYVEGMKVFRTDLSAAIRHWENGARYDPSNTNLQMRLREARLAQRKLERMEKK
jgi:tetratricopeptide (TPR) repeat protein